MRLCGRAVTRYDLYELAAQLPGVQARFLHAVHGGSPETLAEDFSGPASAARAWLALSPDHRAIATDADAEPLDHAERRLSETQGGAALERFMANHTDVMSAQGRADIIASLNFAMCELHTREMLLTYLRHALFRLQPRGVLVADVYGGASALLCGTVEQVIDTDDGELVYTWEQRAADPLTAQVQCAMHFALPDGTVCEDAFVYDWRLWSVPELRDAMREAGFPQTEVYTSLGEAMTEDGELIVAPTLSDADPEAEWEMEEGAEEAFVAYVVGRA